MHYATSKQGIYSAWTIYVKFSSSLMTRSFQRVVAAGGAKVVPQKDVTQADLILTCQELLEEVWEATGHIVPAVGVKYIQATLMHRANPANIYRFVLDSHTPANSLPTTPDKRPRQSSSQISSQSQISSSASPIKSPGLKSKYKRIPFTAEKYHNISTFFNKPSTSSLGSVKRPLVDSGSDNEENFTHHKRIQSKHDGEAAPGRLRSADPDPTSSVSLGGGQGTKDSPHQLVLTIDNMKRSAEQFVRQSRHFNWGTFTPSLPQDDERLTEAEGKMRELTIPEVCYFEGMLDLQDQEPQEVLRGLEILQHNTTEETYPSAQLLAQLLTRLVWKTESCLVYSQSLAYAHRLLMQMPPNSSTSRQYYLKVLECAEKQEEGSGSDLAWSFIKRVIESVQEDSAAGGGCQVSGTHALQLLQFIVTLFKEDISHHKPKGSEAVLKLLTWQVFWGHSRNTANTTRPIKKLLHLWLAAHQSRNLDLQLCTAELVGVVVEVVWLLHSPSLVPVYPLPQSLLGLRHELLITIKGCDADTTGRLVCGLPSPWLQTVISSFFMVDQAQLSTKQLTLKTILDCARAACSDDPTQDFRSCDIEEAEQQKPVLPPSQCATSKTKGKSNNAVNKKNFKGETALMRACIKKDLKRVERLLATPGIDVNLRDNSGWTALHEAAIRGFDKGVKMILTSSPGVVELQARGGEQQHTPLHDAVENDHLTCARLLLQHGGGELLQDRTSSQEGVWDLADSAEMQSLLEQFQQQSSSRGVVQVGGDGRRELQQLRDFFPTQSSLTMVMQRLVHGYLEVSFTRFLWQTIKQEQLSRMVVASRTMQLPKTSGASRQTMADSEGNREQLGKTLKVARIGKENTVTHLREDQRRSVEKQVSPGCIEAMMQAAKQDMQTYSEATSKHRMQTEGQKFQQFLRKVLYEYDQLASGSTTD